MAAKIKKGDRVVLLTGKDKGRSGQVATVMPKEGRVVVSGLNMVKRHTAPAARATRRAASSTRRPRVHVSNVAHRRFRRPASRPASASASRAARRCGSPRQPAR